MDDAESMPSNIVPCTTNIRKQNKIIPTKEQVEKLTKDKALQTIEWLRQYLEAIRVERTGRDIHSKRFFLKTTQKINALSVDDGHKIRLKVLAKEMTKAADALDHLYTRVVGLELVASGVVPEWARGGPETPSNPEFLQALLQSDTNQPTDSSTSAEDADLIKTKLLTRKAQMLRAIQFVWDPDVQNPYMMMFEEFAKSLGETANEAKSISMTPGQLEVLQYKSLGKVSFQDLVSGEDFDEDDMLRFSSLFLGDRLGFTLAWLKDALVEALIMSRNGSGVANVGNIGRANL
ncbi:hypothetical protein C0992_007132 [Termitomyces sp. T32_za158]|nr:hypothetical protein C0992_007132 [Termitomyces sp. T32_za158]